MIEDFWWPPHDPPSKMMGKDMEPYIIPPARERGRPTKITAEQRMFDTELYCREIKLKMKQELETGDLAELNTDLLFMHDSVFGWGEFVATDGLGQPVTWWSEEGAPALRKEENMKRALEDREPNLKVDDYLRHSQQNDI